MFNRGVCRNCSNHTTRREDINSLNVIHIAGTKGKGSTCAFTDSFLRAHGQRTGYPCKTGLYTSPHLISPEERIRIDSKPLEPAVFAKYFFEIYDRLPQLSLAYDPSKPVLERGPRYLQFFALLAIHVFVREKVDVAVFETHNGGEYDATNIVQKPVVTAITSLGMDHVEMLGPSIDDIAWHKSGIYKPGSVALSTTQDSASAEVLKNRAREKGEVVRFVDKDQRLPIHMIQLKPPVQKTNASLAVACVEAFLERKPNKAILSLTADDLYLGVKQWSWPGRFQIVSDGNQTWFLDAAHNQMSVSIAAQWFADSTANTHGTTTRILVFSHISELRDAMGVLKSLAKALQQCSIRIQHAIFTTYDESEEKQSSVPARDPSSFHEIWSGMFPESQIWDEPTVRGAIARVRNLSNEYSESSMQTFITGSQHLVGPALRTLQEGRAFHPK